MAGYIGIYDAPEIEPADLPKLRGCTAAALITAHWRAGSIEPIVHVGARSDPCDPLALEEHRLEIRGRQRCGVDRAETLPGEGVEILTKTAANDLL
jgi:hypothetical protein